MTQANNFTKAQERKIREVGRKIETARLAKRLSIRTAADRTVTSSRAGHMTEATWRRVERATVQTGLGEIIYKPSGATLMAMAEVVDLDGEALCKEIGVTPPPALSKGKPPASSEFEEIRQELRLLMERLDQLAR